MTLKPQNTPVRECVSVLCFHFHITFPIFSFPSSFYTQQFTSLLQSSMMEMQIPYCYSPLVARLEQSDNDYIRVSQIRSWRAIALQSLVQTLIKITYLRFSSDPEYLD